jgi:hypothetical protein
MRAGEREVAPLHPPGDRHHTMVRIDSMAAVSTTGLPRFVDRQGPGRPVEIVPNTFEAQHSFVDRMSHQIAVARGVHDRVECHYESFHDQSVKI